MAGGRFVDIALQSGRNGGGIDFSTGHSEDTAHTDHMPDDDVTPKSDRQQYISGLTRPIPSDVAHVAVHAYPIPLMPNKDCAKGFFRAPSKLKV